MMRQVEYTDPAPNQGDRTPARRGRAGGLLRRTFLIALLLVSGGLITSSAVELFFRYHESVEGIWGLQREMAHGAAFEMQQFVRDIEHTMWAATQTPDIVAAGLTAAYRFQLDKLLKVAPAITTAVALDATGRERLKVSRRQIVQPEDLEDHSQDAAFVHARGGTAFFSPVYFGPEAEPYMRLAMPIEPFPGDVVGVLSAEVRLTYIRDVIAQVAVGRAGYAYVVSLRETCSRILTSVWSSKSATSSTSDRCRWRWTVRQDRSWPCRTWLASRSWRRMRLFPAWGG
jgi:hypothetical protein